jgi:hypothetical protein
VVDAGAEAVNDNPYEAPQVEQVESPILGAPVDPRRAHQYGVFDPRVLAAALIIVGLSFVLPFVVTGCVNAWFW